MNLPKPFISNKYIVNKRVIERYIQKKNEFMKEREKKAWQGIIFTIIITILYYLDIGTDLFLCWKYYINGDVWWF